MRKLIEDIAIALLVLTRIPVDGLLKDLEQVEIYRGQWAYPLVGVLIGFIIFFSIQILQFVGMPQNGLSRANSRGLRCVWLVPRP